MARVEIKTPPQLGRGAFPGVWEVVGKSYWLSPVLAAPAEVSGTAGITWAALVGATGMAGTAWAVGRFTSRLGGMIWAETFLVTSAGSTILLRLWR